MDTDEDPLAFPHLGELWEAAVPGFLQPAGCPGCFSRPRLSGRVTMGSSVLGRSYSVLRRAALDLLVVLGICIVSEIIVYVSI